jgi:hypothetical protein
MTRKLASCHGRACSIYHKPLLPASAAGVYVFSKGEYVPPVVLDGD